LEDKDQSTKRHEIIWEIRKIEIKFGAGKQLIIAFIEEASTGYKEHRKSKGKQAPQIR
jgi:hypothetical protein